MSSPSVDEVTRFVDPFVLRARSRVGTTLRSKWRLDALLGVGGMGAVYASTHRNGSRAAVKLLHPELSGNPHIRSRFLREGYVANAVAHPGAVKVIDDDVAEDGSLFLVTELLEGETLEDRRLRLGGRLAEDDVLSLTDQILEVLIVAHAKGVVHRDLKPENFFLTRDGQVKILDFGIARLRELSTASTATKNGSTLGTPAFMAPEQARGLWDDVDARSDVWAVGATMFNLLSGRLVHEGRTANEHLLSAMTQPAPALGSVVPGVGAAVSHLVDRALAFDKNKRWPDAGRMQEVVRAAYYDRHQKPITTSPRLTVPETASRSAGAEAARLPTTGRPVERSAGPTRVGFSFPSFPWRPQRRALLLGGGVAIFVLVGTVGIVSAVRGGGAPTTTAPSALATIPILVEPAASPAIVTPSAASPPSPPPPEIAATDLPSPAATKALTTPPTKLIVRPAPTVRPPTPAAAGGPKPNCAPPFTLDSAGVKHWKSECL